MKPSVIIVGAGLFGCLAARLAKSRGAQVTVIDNSSEMSASPASGGLMKPSWLSRIPKEGVKIGYEVLDEVCQPIPLTFQVYARAGGLRLPTVKLDQILFIDPARLQVPFVKDAVVKVGNGFVETAKGRRYEGKVLVAAGVWSHQLVNMPSVKSIIGASLRFNTQLKQPAIDLFAPYKQASAFNINDREVWMGDTTALTEKSWGEEAVQRTIRRAADWFKLKNPSTVIVGKRPYVEGHPDGYFAKTHPNTWVATGGAKNGTILGAWHAARFVEEARL